MAWTKNFTLPTNFNNNNQFDTSSVLTPDMFNVPYQNTLYLKDHLDIVEGNLSNIDDSLYNLGAYDSISTENGITTITRQTGYSVLDSNVSIVSEWQSGSNGYWVMAIALPNCDKTNLANVIANCRIWYDQPSYWSQTFTGFLMCVGTSYSENGEILIAYGGATTHEQLISALSQNPISIQYKLATTYTEKVEKNHYSAYNQDFILEHNKSEAEKSANLLNIDDVGSTTINGITYSIKDGVIYLNGTATDNIIIPLIITLTLNGTYYSYTFGRSDNVFTLFYKIDDGSWFDTNKSFVSNNNSWFVRLDIKQGASFNNYSVSPMLVKGTTAPTTYQPYNQNKHITNNEAEFLKTEYDRSANLTPYNLTSFPLNSSQRHLIAENLPSGTYTLSLNLNAYNGGSEYIVYINDNSIGTYSNGKSATFTSNNYINSIKISSNDATATSAKVMLNEGSIALPYQEYEGKIVHLKDLEFYGTKPAIANVQCPIDLSKWNDDTNSYSSGSNVPNLRFDNTSLGNIYLLPTSSSGSMTKGIVRYTGGDTDAFTWSISAITSNYIELSCATKFRLYAPASSSGTLKTANYVLEIEDMYGHTFSLPFSVNYRK